jgi:GTP-binding protein
MEIKNAKFLKSSSNNKHCPPPDKPEFAFIGRSNVGKSSLINMLCNEKNLAKTSSKPGKTQLINHFIIDNKWYLVDLPGYGYAKTSKTNLDKFEELISNYITKRKNLICVIILIDSRLELQPIDGEFMDWCTQHEIPFCLAFTKIDKLGKNQWASNFMKYKKRLMDYWGELPQIFETSAEKRQGKETILEYIGENMQYFIPPPKGVKATNDDDDEFDEEYENDNDGI